LIENQADGSGGIQRNILRTGTVFGIAVLAAFRSASRQRIRTGGGCGLHIMLRPCLDQQGAGRHGTIFANPGFGRYGGIGKREGRADAHRLSRTAGASGTALVRGALGVVCGDGYVVVGHDKDIRVAVRNGNRILLGGNCLGHIPGFVMIGVCDFIQSIPSQGIHLHHAVGGNADAPVCGDNRTAGLGRSIGTGLGIPCLVIGGCGMGHLGQCYRHVQRGSFLHIAGGCNGKGEFAVRFRNVKRARLLAVIRCGVSIGCLCGGIDRVAVFGRDGDGCAVDRGGGVGVAERDADALAVHLAGGLVFSRAAVTAVVTGAGREV